MALSSLPTHLTSVEKRRTFATKGGWAVPAGGNDNPLADPEILSAVRSLATRLSEADINSLNWITGSAPYSKAAGGTIGIAVNFNEKVTVTGSPQLTLTNDTPARNLTLTLQSPVSGVSGSGTNRLLFKKVIAADAADLNATDVLSLGANVLALNGGTIKDIGTSVNSSILNVASIGTDAGSITVGA